jgi:glycerol-3-phosphate acyltransferase PlsY
MAWLACAFASRYSSFAALTASGITPIFLWWAKAPQLAVLATFLTLLLWFMHRENIKRLVAGTEGKIGAK